MSGQLGGFLGVLRNPRNYFIPQCLEEGSKVFEQSDHAHTNEDEAPVGMPWLVPVVSSCWEDRVHWASGSCSGCHDNSMNDDGSSDGSNGHVDDDKNDVSVAAVFEKEGAWWERKIDEGEKKIIRTGPCSFQNAALGGTGYLGL